MKNNKKTELQKLTDQLQKALETATEKKANKDKQREASKTPEQKKAENAKRVSEEAEKLTKMIGQPEPNIPKVQSTLKSLTDAANAFKETDFPVFEITEKIVSLVKKKLNIVKKKLKKNLGIKILKQGVKKWNQWKEINFTEKIDLSETDFKEANLSRVNLSGANLGGANLSYANLGYANLSYADISYGDLSGANLCGADLSYANLRGTNLNHADLNRANLAGTDLRNADLREADLQEANLLRSNLIGADLESIKIDEKTLTYIQENIQLKFKGKWFIFDIVDKNLIFRLIEIPPEYHEAGIFILNHFGDILQKKYQDTKAKIQIRQDDLKITMIIDPVGGDREIIEKELDKYEPVVNEKEVNEVPDVSKEEKKEEEKKKEKMEIFETHQNQLLLYIGYDRFIAANQIQEILSYIDSIYDELYSTLLKINREKIPFDQKLRISKAHTGHSIELILEGLQWIASKPTDQIPMIAASTAAVILTRNLLQNITTGNIPETWINEIKIIDETDKIKDEADRMKAEPCEEGVIPKTHEMIEVINPDTVPLETRKIVINYASMLNDQIQNDPNIKLVTINRNFVFYNRTSA